MRIGESLIQIERAVGGCKRLWHGFAGRDSGKNWSKRIHTCKSRESRRVVWSQFRSMGKLCDGLLKTWSIALVPTLKSMKICIVGLRTHVRGHSEPLLGFLREREANLSSDFEPYVTF